VDEVAEVDGLDGSAEEDVRLLAAEVAEEMAPEMEEVIGLGEVMIVGCLIGRSVDR